MRNILTVIGFLVAGAFIWGLWNGYQACSRGLPLDRHASEVSGADLPILGAVIRAGHYQYHGGADLFCKG